MAVSAAGGDVAALAVDAGALDSLKRTARDDPKRALSAAASQFEALFVQMLLKSMREALPQDGMLQSDSGKMYTGMFDQQIAQQMSARGIGLKQMLERQLAPALGLGASAPSAAGTGGPTGSAIGTATPGTAHPSGAGELHPLERRGHAPRAAAMPASSTAAMRKATAPAVAGTADHPGVLAQLPANVRKFIETMRPHAEAAAKAVGVPAELLLAQAGLETGWGKAQPRASDGAASHNLFGIKAGRGWSGSVALASTTEYVAGALVRTVDRFRSYGSYTEAFQDFGRLITGNARYAGAVKAAGDPASYARALQQGGYATDPQYADKLLRAVKMVASYQGGSLDTAQVTRQAAVNPSRTSAA